VSENIQRVKELYCDVIVEKLLRTKTFNSNSNIFCCNTFFLQLLFNKRWDSSVDTATSCGLDGPGFEYRLGKEVFLFSRTVHTEYLVGNWVLSQG
jgi:hypothetical protein